MRPELVWPVGALLGEGPVWLPEEGALRFVDIKRGRLHRYLPGTDARETVEVGGAPSFVVPADDGGLLVGHGHAVRRFDGARLGDAVTTVEMVAGNRLNDATADDRGRLWFGSMDDAEREPTGAIHCLDRGALHLAGGRAVVTNGPAVSVDGRTLYHVDSGERIVWRCPIGDAPVLGEGEPFVTLRPDEGHPDGIVVDAEDCLWVALWDGWGVRRYAPDGRLLLHVDLPAARVTKVALGGPDLRTAYVTTARIGLDEAALAAQPLAGGLFRFPAPAPGRVLPAVRLA